MGKMLLEDSVALRRKIEVTKGIGAVVYIDFSRVSKKSRTQIEEAADNFLDLVKKILDEE